MKYIRPKAQHTIAARALGIRLLPPCNPDLSRLLLALQGNSAATKLMGLAGACSCPSLCPVNIVPCLAPSPAARIMRNLGAAGAWRLIINVDR